MLNMVSFRSKLALGLMSGLTSLGCNGQAEKATPVKPRTVQTSPKSEAEISKTKVPNPRALAKTVITASGAKLNAVPERVEIDPEEIDSLFASDRDLIKAAAIEPEDKTFLLALIDKVVEKEKQGKPSSINTDAIIKDLKAANNKLQSLMTLGLIKQEQIPQIKAALDFHTPSVNLLNGQYDLFHAKRFTLDEWFELSQDTARHPELKREITRLLN